MFFYYLFCYIKEDSQAILLFCLVWSVFASIRDMLPIRVIWFWYCVTVRATFLPVNYFTVRLFGFYRWWFFCRIIFPPVYINIKGPSFRQINWGCSRYRCRCNMCRWTRCYWHAAGSTFFVNWNTRWGTNFRPKDLINGFLHCHLINRFLLCTCGQKMIDIMRRGQTRTKGAFFSRAIGRGIVSGAYR